MASQYAGMSIQEVNKFNQDQTQKAYAPFEKLDPHTQDRIKAGQEVQNLRGQITKAKLEQELASIKGKNGGSGESGGSGGLGQPISGKGFEADGGNNGGFGIEGMPKSMAELETMSDRMANKDLERQKKAWEAAAGFRNTEDLREHGQQLQTMGIQNTAEKQRLGMQLGSQEKLTRMTEAGQTGRTRIQDTGETKRLGMSLSSQENLTGMTEAGQTNRLGMQLGSQEKLAKMQDFGETNRLGMQIGSSERMQKAGFDQDYKMTGYQQELGERTKQQDASRAARAFKQF